MVIITSKLITRSESALKYVITCGAEPEGIFFLIKRALLGCFFCENPNLDFRIQKRILLFWGANPNTDHESIESTLRVDSLDQIQIRSFEIHNLSDFLEKDLKKVFLTSGFSKKKKWYVTDAVHV